jgi:hypothetical protein
MAIFLLVSSIAYAQSAVPDAVYRQTDDILGRKSIPELNELLSKSSKSAWYPKLETYVLKKARQMVVDNQLDEARDVSNALIDNNLDNLDAVEFYQSVQTAIAKRDAEAKKVAEKEALNEYKQKAGEVKIKQDLSKTYKPVTNASSGKKVYLDQDFNNHYSSYTWDFLLGLANASVTTDSSALSVKYGVSASGSVFYHGEVFSVGADIDGNAMFVSILGNKTMNWSASAVASLSSNGLSKYFVLRAGYTMIGLDYGNTAIASSQFWSPVVGLGLHDVRMGESGRFQLAVDYYPAHLWIDSMTLALGGNMYMAFMLADMNDFDVYLKTGIKDDIFLTSSGIRNDARLVLSIGVGNYE